MSNIARHSGQLMMWPYAPAASATFRRKLVYSQIFSSVRCISASLKKAGIGCLTPTPAISLRFEERCRTQCQDGFIVRGMPLRWNHERYYRNALEGTAEYPRARA